MQTVVLKLERKSQKVNALMKNLSCKENSKKLKVTLMLNCKSPLSSSPKSSKNEYQHSISSISNTNFMSILRFEGARFKKALGAVSKRGTIS